MPTTDETSSETPKDRAIAAAGGLSRLAEKLDITRSAVSQWKEIPLERVLEIEEKTGIPREELRPDFFVRTAPSGTDA